MTSAWKVIGKERRDWRGVHGLPLHDVGLDAGYPFMTDDQLMDHDKSTSIGSAVHDSGI
jgi:hypothetical protein